MESRADLYIHSNYSNRPSEWLSRRIGALAAAGQCL